MTQMIQNNLARRINSAAEPFNFIRKQPERQSQIGITEPADPDATIESGRSQGELSSLLVNQTSKISENSMQGMLGYSAKLPSGMTSPGQTNRKKFVSVRATAKILPKNSDLSQSPSKRLGWWSKKK